MSNELDNSRFHMWRAVVAMIHADGVVTPHEISFVTDYIFSMGLSPKQIDIIAEDLQTPQDAYHMFAYIKEREDKRDFFVLARALSWCDGKLDEQEKRIIENLEELHMNDESRDLLKESREILNEVELSRNQWTFKTKRSKNLLGFLNEMRAA